MPSGKSAATTPAAVNEVSLPYMAMPGRPARVIAARIIDTSPLTAAISHGEPGLASRPLMVDKTPLTIRAYQQERPILSAGVRLTGWQVGDEVVVGFNKPRVKELLGL